MYTPFLFRESHQNFKYMLRSKFIQTVILVFKWILFFFFLFIAIACLVDKKTIPFIAFIVGALVLLPPINSRLKQKFSIFSKWYTTAIAVFICFSVGVFNFSPKTTSTSDKKEGVETNFNSKEAIENVNEYVKENQEKPIFKNVKILNDNFELFKYEYKYDIERVEKEKVSVDEKAQIVHYRPFTGIKFETDKFLYKFGKTALKGYEINFYLDNENEIKNVEALAIFDKDTVPWANNVLFSNYLILENIKAAEKEEQAERINRAQREKFPTHCISSWDGSCPHLESVIKASMNDPDSYKHVETKWWDNNDYAIVLVKFRGKNAFGGYVINYCKAKVSWDCEVLEIIESGS